MTWAALLVALALNSGISFAYVWLLEASFGFTLGKAMVGIRVTRTNGRNAFAASAIRNRGPYAPDRPATALPRRLGVQRWPLQDHLACIS